MLKLAIRNEFYDEIPNANQAKKNGFHCFLAFFRPKLLKRTISRPMKPPFLVLKTVDSRPKSVRRQKSSDQKRGVNLDAVGHLSSAFKKDPYA